RDGVGEAHAAVREGPHRGAELDANDASRGGGACVRSTCADQTRFLISHFEPLQPERIASGRSRYPFLARDNASPSRRAAWSSRDVRQITGWRVARSRYASDLRGPARLDGAGGAEACCRPSNGPPHTASRRRGSRSAMMKKHRLLAFSLLAICPAVTLVACGSDEGNPPN